MECLYVFDKAPESASCKDGFSLRRRAHATASPCPSLVNTPFPSSFMFPPHFPPFLPPLPPSFSYPPLYPAIEVTSLNIAEIEIEHVGFIIGMPRVQLPV